MKHTSGIIVLAILGLLAFSPIASEVSAVASQNALSIQFIIIGAGQTSMTNNTLHTSPFVGKLLIPTNAPQGSGCMVLYPYSETLTSLESFQVYLSYTTALPRFVILIDTDENGQADITLLSDYPTASNGYWQLLQGGQIWGWTNASLTLDNYGSVWGNLSYWKEIYGSANVLSVGVALEYWAVADSNGLGSPLYTDEIIINGVTYTIANQNTTTTDDWSMYRHDLQSTGTSQSPVVNDQLLWKFYAGSSGLNRLRSSPIIADGILYMGTENNRFYALNATIGSQIWHIDVGAPVLSSAAVKDGVVYVGITWNGCNGYVEAMNATNGKIIWQFPTESGIESSPTVVNDVVYIGSYKGYVYALDASNGTLNWSYRTGAEVFASPSIVNGTLYVGSLDGYVYALTADNGALIWKSYVGNQVYSSPAVVNGMIYVCTDAGYVCALRDSDGEEIWQAYIGSGSDHEDASPAIANGIVYFGARNGFYAFNATNGEQIWFFTSPYSVRQTAGYFYSSPAVAGNAVYCGSVDNRLFALNANDGSIIWSYQTGGFLFSSPAIANGVVYIGSYDGNIYAVGNPANRTSQSSPTPSLPTTENQTQTPTSTPTASSTPDPTVPPTPETPPPSPTITPTEAPSLLSKTQHVKEPIPLSGYKNSETIDWTVLCAIVVAFVITLISLFLLFKKCD